MNRGPKILVWTYIPTHHQFAFFQAMRDDGIDLVVHYFQRVRPARLRLGWENPETLPKGERFVQPRLASLQECPDWNERIHIIPGYGAAFLFLVALRLSKHKVAWMNWSEASRQSARWYFNYPFKRAYAALINQYAMGALAIGDMARADFIKWGIDRRLIRFLPYSMPALEPSARTAESVTAGSPQFTFVGALCHRKGIDILLRAFQTVLQRHAGAKLNLVGYDETGGSYRQLADHLGLARAVTFAGSVPAAQIGGSLRDCDVLVLPSRFDGWGMVINEAASLGKALIATDACGAAHHLIVPDVNGFRVPRDDHRALAEAMVRYCREPDLARRHGEESRRMFLDFTPTRNVARFRQCLDSLRGARGRVGELPVSFISQLQPCVVADTPVSDKISIVMPTFNHRAFIERSILSVLNQDYPNLEFIIVDGGSKDGTVEIIKKYASHLAYWVSEPDGGQSDALNKGFRHATGEIFGWLNSDDLYLPGAFAQAARAFAENPLKRIVHGDWLAIDAEDDIIAHEYSFDFSLNQFKYEGFHINAQAMFWKRDVHSRFSGFDAGLYNTMDYQMILEFGINEGVSAFSRVSKALGCFRRHPDQKTVGFTDRVLNEHRLIADRYGYRDKYRMAGKAKRFLFRFRRAYWYLRRGGFPYFLERLVVGQKNG